jgi:hypothetical protein
MLEMLRGLPVLAAFAGAAALTDLWMVIADDMVSAAVVLKYPGALVGAWGAARARAWIKRGAESCARDLQD